MSQCCGYFPCPSCEKIYRSDGSRRRHLKYQCGKQKPPLTGFNVTEDKVYECDECKKSYKHFSSMRRHKLYECGKVPNIQCPILNCVYKAKINDRMIQHVRMVHKMDI
ncbi:hypothetical protein WA026_020859 [Henosepilachna vigintioctopunctata]|uniref:C2H2-type domain-containing protein n=1 Tax=Henosepilachna vigintioctopunctata TaxID=420089 RepID=A0AAW1UP92_9CUCU